MSLVLKPGTRIFSAVDSTELIVVKAPADAVDLTIGGFPAVLSADERTDAASLEGHNGGVAMGKRYIDTGETLELLAIKTGAGVPAVNGELMVVKAAKPLPASD